MARNRSDLYYYESSQSLENYSTKKSSCVNRKVQAEGKWMNGRQTSPTLTKWLIANNSQAFASWTILLGPAGNMAECSLFIVHSKQLTSYSPMRQACEQQYNQPIKME